MVSQLHISVMAEIELVLSDSAATEWVEVIEELAIPGLQVSKLPFYLLLVTSIFLFAKDGLCGRFAFPLFYFVSQLCQSVALVS